MLPRASLLLCAVASFSIPFSVAAADPVAKPDRLTREEAVVRAKQLTRIHYSLNFDLTTQVPVPESAPPASDNKTSASAATEPTSTPAAAAPPPTPRFKASARITFQLRPNARDFGGQTFLELRDAEITSFALNGDKWAPIEISDHYDGRRLRLNLSDLKKSNLIEISYIRAYQNDGVGLHRFTDPEDKRVYLYTHFEPYHAHLVFPCFDQPDLKATYSLEVTAPAEWQVIANTLETAVASVTPAEGARAPAAKRWTFGRTKPFSTYLFALIAGPYAVWKSHATVDGVDVPLRLFARRSQSKFVDSPEWFKITRAGLDFYSLEFGVPYPFGKYDQILVPEFNVGAMENVGAVTFNERAIFRTRVTEERRRGRADTILHELAHQWFGNLTTMRWWNGLWLNESFATFLATLALDKATSHEGAWLAFHTYDKAHAYFEDGLETTHPVEQQVTSTEQADASFDSITYGKGAASLQQLYALTGPEDFREGLQRYFEAYAYQNTTIADFFRKMAEASGLDLLKWQQLWLQTPGTNTVRAQWACAPHPESGTPAISSFQLVQGPDGEIRTHRTEIGLYAIPRDGRSPLVRLARQDKKRVGKRRRPVQTPAENPSVAVTHSQGLTEVPELVEQACPDFVLPNADDTDYIRVELDEASLAQLKKNLWRLNDPLARALAWDALWDQTQFARLRVTDYLEMVMRHLPREKNITVLTRVLRTLWGRIPQSVGALSLLEETARHKWTEKLEAWTRAQLAAAPAGSDLQIAWFSASVRQAQSAGSARWLKRLLSAQASVKGLAIEKDRRWEVIQAYARSGAKDATAVIAEEREADPSDFAAKEALGAEAALPVEETKSSWIARLTSDEGTKLGLSGFRAALHSIQDARDERWGTLLAPAVFARLAELENSPRPELEEFESELAESGAPFACSAERASEIRKFLAAHPGLKPAVSKALRNTAQMAERCTKARALLGGTTSVAPARPGSDPSPSPASDVQSPPTDPKTPG